MHSGSEQSDSGIALLVVKGIQMSRLQVVPKKSALLLGFQRGKVFCGTAPQTNSCHALSNLMINLRQVTLLIQGE